MAEIPETTTALVLPDFKQPLTLDKSPTKTPGHGTALVRVLHSVIRPYHRQSFAGNGFFSYPLPYNPGHAAIARVVATGPDAVALQPGQLVLVDCFLHARDDPDATQVMLALHDGAAPAPRTLFAAWAGLWRDLAAVPLELCMPLDEPALTRLGYSTADALYLERLAVANGGVSASGARPGDSVIVTPASGIYSGAIVEVLAQIGCRVVAVTRDAAKLRPLTSRHPRVVPVQLSGDQPTDAAAIRAACARPSAGADALIEISPFQASASPNHLLASLDAVRTGGRAVIMGAMPSATLPLSNLMMRNLTLKFQWMYSHDQVASIIRAVETGVVALGPAAGHEVVDGGWPLRDWERALEVAEGVTQWGRQTMFSPGTAE